MDGEAVDEVPLVDQLFHRFVDDGLRVVLVVDGSLVVLVDDTLGAAVGPISTVGLSLLAETPLAKADPAAAPAAAATATTLSGVAGAAAGVASTAVGALAAAG